MNIRRIPLALLALLGTLNFGALPATAEPMFGLTTTNQIVRFDSELPSIIESTLAVTGLQASESLLDIDFRPSDGALYALGSSNRLYKINLTTGAATAVGGAAFTPALTGTTAAIDFNPVADVLRVVTDTDTNFRLNPTTGAVLGPDTDVAYEASDTNFGANPAISCNAYSNSFVGATSTTLFAIDTDLDILVTQGSVAGNPSSPNTGLLFTQATLGTASTSQCSLDFSGFSGIPYAVFTAPSAPTSTLYRLDLGLGTSLGKLGTLGDGSLVVRAISVPISDTEAPVVTITTPATTSTTTTKSSIRVIGTVTDNLGVSSIEYRVTNNGVASDWKTVSGTTSFSFKVTLKAGKNKIDIRATDLYGNISAADRVTVKRK